MFFKKMLEKNQSRGDISSVYFSFTRILAVWAVVFFLPGLSGCAGGSVYEEDNLPPDSPYEKAWLDEHSGDDENLGPNSPGYIGPDGEFSMYPESDPQ